MAFSQFWSFSDLWSGEERSRAFADQPRGGKATGSDHRHTGGDQAGIGEWLGSAGWIP
jgi:hypothetical protein